MFVCLLRQLFATHPFFCGLDPHSIEPRLLLDNTVLTPQSPLLTTANTLTRFRMGKRKTERKYWQCRRCVAHIWIRKVRFFDLLSYSKVCYISSDRVVKFHGFKEGFPSMLCDMQARSILDKCKLQRIISQMFDSIHIVPDRHYINYCFC